MQQKQGLRELLLRGGGGTDACEEAVAVAALLAALRDLVERAPRLAGDLEQEEH